MDKHSIVNWLLEENLLEADKHLEEARRIDKEAKKPDSKIIKKDATNASGGRGSGKKYQITDHDKKFGRYEKFDTAVKKEESLQEIHKDIQKAIQAMKVIDFQTVYVKARISNSVKIHGTDKEKAVADKALYSYMKGIDGLDAIMKDFTNILADVIEKIQKITKVGKNVYKLLAKFTDPLYDYINGYSDEGYEESDSYERMNRLENRRYKSLEKLLNSLIVFDTEKFKEDMKEALVKDGIEKNVDLYTNVFTKFIKQVVNILNTYKIKHIEISTQA